MDFEVKRSEITKNLNIGDEVVIVIPGLAQDKKVRDVIKDISETGMTHCIHFTFYPDGRAMNFDSPRPYILGKASKNRIISIEKFK
jgi:hypothetical protein